MKPASAALIALLNSGEQFIMVDLYTFTLVGGATILRYSAAPTSIVANGYLFTAGPKFERSKTNVVIGTQVDELDIKIYPETTDLVGATSFLEAAWQGQFDGALLQLQRAFMGAAGGGYGDTSAGTVILFSGRISDIDCSRTGIDMKCRSHLELLNIQMPRRLWQSSCTHVFGDAMCLFNRSSSCCHILGRKRIDDDRHPRGANDDDALRARDDHCHHRRQCRLQSHDIDLCQRRRRNGQARLSVAGCRWRSIPVAAGLRSHARDLHQRFQQRHPFWRLSLHPDPGDRCMTRHDPRRLVVVEEARGWLGTPYHHMGRVKGAGTDGAIVVEWPRIIHARVAVGVIYGDATQPKLASRKPRFLDPFVNIFVEPK